MAQASMGHWDTHTGKQQQHQPRQHLVEFQGRTLCISTEKQPTTSGVVLQSLYAALHVSKTAVDALEAPWRLMCCGRFLAPEDRVPALSVLRVWTGGLKGGKGGFGAMLRAMAKQASKRLEFANAFPIGSCVQSC